MSSNKYIISLTTIPSRINYIETTIKSLVEQTLKPEKIILNIPKKYNFRFESSIDNITIKKILNKYIDDIIINYIDDDYGPGTKLLGVIKSSIISLDLKDTYIVLVDDDHIYKPFMLECFNNYNAEHHDNKLKIASFYCYNSYGVVIGQGADSIFIRLEMLNNFEDYYDIIKNYDYINYHDDWYIYYSFHLKQIEIEYIKLADDSSIYTKQISSDIDALESIRDQNNRNNLNCKLNEILSKLNNEGKFDEVKKKSSEECIFSNCYFYSFSNLKNVYSLSFPRFKLYCGYHSYNYSFYHDNLETVYKPHWNKILYGMKLLKKNLNVKYFIWLDHDIIIKNFDIKIHQIIKDYNFENNKANFMMSEDPISGLNFNSGVCIFKNNVKTLAVFNKMIDNRNNPTNHPSFEKYFEEKYSCGKRMDWLDFHKKGSLQDTRTFLFHFHENPEDLLSVPHRVLQSFYPYHIDRPLHQYKLGDFCGHVAGPQGKKLIQYMNDLINYSALKETEIQNDSKFSRVLLDKTNCEIITTTLSNNKISELRKENIINNFQKKYEFNINFIEGVKYDNWGKNEQFQTTLKMLKTFEKSNYKYGIICQDDFFPIDNFLQELNTTIELLPDTWECLHLCPGFLWGRQFRDKSKIGQYCPEYNMDKTTFNYHKSGRFFIDCNPKEYYDHNLWLGGPVAFIIKHACITQFIHKYKQNFDHDDRTLVNMLNNNTFICRNPQLGYEEECGGTTLK